MQNVDSGQTQENYQETPYADQSWEIIGEVSEEQVFIPMDVPVVSSNQFAVDPMFADYGGITSGESTNRWHLPEGESVETFTVEDTRDAEIEELQRQHAEELERVKAEIKEQATQEAIEATKTEYETQMQLMHETFRALFEDLQAQIQENFSRIEAGALELSLSIAKKLVDGAVDINPEYIVKLVHEALEKTGTAIVHRVRVSPQDMEFIDVVGIRKLIKEYDGSWDFEADETVKSGCVVETSAGEIDYQLDAAWERICDQVMKVSRSS